MDLLLHDPTDEDRRQVDDLDRLDLGPGHREQVRGFLRADTAGVQVFAEPLVGNSRHPVSPRRPFGAKTTRPVRLTGLFCTKRLSFIAIRTAG